MNIKNHIAVQKFDKKYKLYKKSVSTRVISKFFTERVLNAWNGLPENRTDFSSLSHFKNSSLY